MSSERAWPEGGQRVDTDKEAFPTVSGYPGLNWTRFGRIVAAIAVSVAVIVAVGCSGNESSKIVFVSDRDGDPDIYVMGEDGSNQTALTSNGGLDEDPRLSPDKRWVAFISKESGDREINRVDLSKKEPIAQRLTHSPGADEMHHWSPDGQRLAFVSNRDGQPEIYLMNANGSNFTRVTFDLSRPRLNGWSPDGQWIAFIVDGDDGEPGIITRNPDGVNVRRLTKGKDYDATWSTDGQKIAFTSELDGNLEINVMNSDGSGLTRLTQNTEKDFQPTWSPDGKQLAFTSERDGNREIYVMMADGSSQQRLTYNEAKDETPVWSPDGKRIAFVSYMYGTSEIIVMDAAGSNQTRLTNNTANDTQPTW